MHCSLINFTKIVKSDHTFKKFSIHWVTNIANKTPNYYCTVHAQKLVSAVEIIIVSVTTIGLNQSAVEQHLSLFGIDT